MRRYFYTLFIIFFTVTTNVVAQESDSAQKHTDEKSDFQITFYFSSNSSWWIEKDEYPKTVQLLRWAKNNPQKSIHIVGWADNTGSDNTNKRLSLQRAKTIYNYLVKNGIDAQRITFEGCGVDNNAKTKAKARRADVSGIVTIIQDITSQQTKSEETTKGQTQVETSHEQAPVDVIVEETTHQSGKSLQNVEPQAETFYKFALRTNLLHWALATPNVGIEWRPTSLFSLVVDADYAPWRWNNKLNYYRMWNVQPQIRFYVNRARNLYVGGEFHVGELNWKFKTKGHQGNFIGGGLVLGYSMKLNRSLDLDFNIGGGYTNYKYDRYETIDGTLFPYEKNLTKNYWGITSAGVSLVWKICK